MKVARIIIPIIAFMLSLVGGYALSRSEEAPVRELLQESARKGEPVMITFGLTGTKMHSLDGREINYHVQWGGEQGYITPYLIVGDDGRITAISSSFVIPYVQAWQCKLPSTRMRPGEIVRSNGLQTGVGTQNINSPWYPLLVNEEIVLHNLQTKEERLFKCNSVPPWLRGKGNLYSWNLEVSPDATAAVASYSDWPNRNYDVWRYDAAKDDWKQLASGQKYEMYSMGPEGRIIGLLDRSIGKMQFIDGATGASIFSAADAYSPTVSGRWAGYIDASSGTNFGIVLFDMQDGWKRYEIPMSDAIPSNAVARQYTTLSIFEPGGEWK